MKRAILSIIAVSASLMVATNATALGFGGDTTEQNQGQGQLQGQAQGQLQGQAQGQGQFSVNKNGNYNGNVNLNGNSNKNNNSNKNSNSNRNSSSSKSTGVGIGVAAAYSDGSAANNSMTLNQQYDAYDKDNTPDAYAPALTTSNGTCMGSSSIGGSGPGVGLSIGSTWSDDACSRRYNAKMMLALGHKDVAVNIMCQDESVAKAAPTLCNPEKLTTTAGTKIDMSYRPGKDVVSNEKFDNGFWQ